MMHSIFRARQSGAVWLALCLTLLALSNCVFAELHAATSIGYYRKLSNGEYQVRPDWLQDRDGLDVGYCQNIYQRNFAMWELHQCWVYDNEEIAQFYPGLNITYGGVAYQRLLAMPMDIFNSRQLPKYPILQTDLDTPGLVNYKPSIVQGKTIDNAVYYKFLTPTLAAFYLNNVIDPYTGERTAQANVLQPDGTVAREIILDGLGVLDALSMLSSQRNDLQRMLRNFDRVDHQSYTVVIDRSKPDLDKVTLRFRVRNSDLVSGVLDNVTALVPVTFNSDSLNTVYGDPMFERTITQDGQIFVSFYPRKLVTGMYPIHFVAYPKCTPGSPRCMAISHAVKIEVVRTCLQEGLVPEGRGDCRARPASAPLSCPVNFTPDTTGSRCLPTVCFLSTLPNRESLSADMLANNDTQPLNAEVNGYICQDYGTASRGAQWRPNCQYWQKMTMTGCQNCTAGQLQSSIDIWSCFTPNVAVPPVGNVTSFNCSVIAGWALDRNYPDGQGVIIEIWANGPRGKGTFVTTVQAEPPALAVNGTQAGTWSWNVAPEYSSVNGTTTNYFIYAQDDVFSSWDAQIHESNQLEMLCFFVQDCKVSNWTDWTNCSAPCNGGFQSRNRSITVPAIGRGAGSCPPDLSQSRPCNTDPCQDCVMSAWSEFDGCSRQCPDRSFGRMGRTRQVVIPAGPGGKSCPTKTVDTKLCNYPGECDGVQGPWNRTVSKCYTSAWELWGHCSTDCNHPSELGRQTRYRAVYQPQEPIPKDFDFSQCPPLSETRTGCRAPQWCFEEPPIDCVVSEWGQWQDCTEECYKPNSTNGGWSYRQRTIVVAPNEGGYDCPELVEWKPCNRYACRECQVSNWTYGDCSTMCGGGVQVATREVLVPPQGENECPALTQVVACNTQECVPQECQVGNWTEWSPCTAVCDGRSPIAYGYTLTTRPILVEPMYGGARCPDLYDEASCNITCEVYDTCKNVTCPANALGCRDGVCLCPNFYGGPNCDVPPSLTAERVSLPNNHVFYPGNRVDIRWKKTGQLPSVALLLTHPGWQWPVYILRAAPNNGDVFWKLPNSVELYRMSLAGALNPAYFLQSDMFASLVYQVPSLETMFTEQMSSAIDLLWNYPPSMNVPNARYSISIFWDNQIRDVTDGFTFSDACSNVVCSNNGTCNNGLCQCSNGFSGVYCTISPCNANSCGVTGHGICVAPPAPAPGQPPQPMICQCTDGYTGPRCDQPPTCTTQCAHGLITDPTTCKCNCSVDTSGNSVPPVWAGETCSTCTLYCNSVDTFATPDEACTNCICSAPTGTRGYEGQFCNQAYQKLALLMRVPVDTVSSTRDRNMFVDLLARDVAFTLNLTTDRVRVANVYPHEQATDLSWVDVLLLDPPNGTTGVDSTTLYETLRSELASNSSLLWTGYATSRVDTSYLPPPPDKPPATGETTTTTPTWAIVLIVLGIAAGLGVAAYFYKKRKEQGGGQKKSVNKKRSSSEEEAEEEEEEEVDEEAGEAGEEEVEMEEEEQ